MDGGVAFELVAEKNGVALLDDAESFVGVVAGNAVDEILIGFLAEALIDEEVRLS